MEENNSIVNNELKDMRIRENPIEISGSLLVDDRLEEQGTIKIYEYIGGDFISGARALIVWKCPTCGMDFHKEVRQLPEGWQGLP